MAPKNEIYLSDAEMEEVQAIAKLEGIGFDAAASKYVQQTIARRFKRNTGKTPAKVYQLKGRK